MTKFLKLILITTLLNNAWAIETSSNKSKTKSAVKTNKVVNPAATAKSKKDEELKVKLKLIEDREKLIAAEKAKEEAIEAAKVKEAQRILEENKAIEEKKNAEKPALSKFFGALSAAKKALDKQAEENNRAVEVVPSSNITKVNNSQFVIDQIFSSPAKWAMVYVIKNQIQETIIFPVSNGKLKKNIYLRHGKGEYKIEIYFTNNPKKYEDNYSWINTLEIVNTDVRDLSFLLPSPAVQSDDPQIIAIANKLVLGVTRDEDKVKIIHDYVARTITYNTKGVEDGSYKKDETDALTVLKNPISVCAGYANLFAAISRAANIRTSIVHGNAMGPRGSELHAWNEVYIGKKWLIVDVTWDDYEEITYDYLFPTPEKFAIDHQKLEVKIDF